MGSRAECREGSTEGFMILPFYFGTFFATEPTTQCQYLAFMQSRREQDSLDSLTASTAFQRRDSRWSSVAGETGGRGEGDVGDWG